MTRWEQLSRAISINHLFGRRRFLVRMKSKASLVRLGAAPTLWAELLAESVWEGMI